MSIKSCPINLPSIKKWQQYWFAFFQFFKWNLNRKASEGFHRDGGDVFVSFYFCFFFPLLRLWTTLPLSKITEGWLAWRYCISQQLHSSSWHSRKARLCVTVYISFQRAFDKSAAILLWLTGFQEGTWQTGCSSVLFSAFIACHTSELYPSSHDTGLQKRQYTCPTIDWEGKYVLCLKLFLFRARSLILGNHRPF